MKFTKEFSHINGIAHEGKILLVGVDSQGSYWYTVKQDGFEDSFLNNPEQGLKGWEEWNQVEFPREEEDASVAAKEAEELTIDGKPDAYLLKSCYDTRERSDVAPFQLVSALGHIYFFRQSKKGSVLVDRFVLDGMANQLKRKLEVRFKRSRQKFAPIDALSGGTESSEMDSMDFRDSNGEFFYEPTTGLCFLTGLEQGKGWFSVVLMPTGEHEKFRWHFFHSSEEGQVVITSVRCSEEGLFDIRDYDFMEPSPEDPALLSPHRIEGLTVRNLNLSVDGEELKLTGAPVATKYDLQVEKKTESGIQLMKDATRLMLMAPTAKGTVSLSFGIANDGTLSDRGSSGEVPSTKILRSFERDVALPINTLENVAIYVSGEKREGTITGVKKEDDKGRLVITTGEPLVNGTLNPGESIRLKRRASLDGHYEFRQNEDESSKLLVGAERAGEMGYWEKVEKNPEVMRPGSITGLSLDGKDLTLNAVDLDQHLADEGTTPAPKDLQLTGTPALDGEWKVVSVQGQEITLNRKWAPGMVVNPAHEMKRRRSIQFDGAADSYIESAPLKMIPPQAERSFAQTYSAWVFLDDLPTGEAVIIGENGSMMELLAIDGKMTLRAFLSNGEPKSLGHVENLPIGKWTHCSGTLTYSFNMNEGVGKTTATLFLNGEQCQTAEWWEVHPLRKPARRTRKGALLTNRQACVIIGKSFPGKICEARVWETARTSREIKDSLYVCLEGKEPGLVAYWRLGAIVEGKERIVAEFTSLRANGTVHGQARVDVVRPQLELRKGAEYRNEEMVAVTQLATYRETFEISCCAVLDDEYPAITALKCKYWGKKNRASETSEPVAVAAQIEPTDDPKWHKVTCQYQVPNGISLLRSFGISDLAVGVDPAEIQFRNHRLTLVSDSITAKSQTDEFKLETRDGSVPRALAKDLKALEEEKGNLLCEKWNIEDELSDVGNKKRKALIEELEKRLTIAETRLKSAKNYYNSVKANKLYHWVRIRNGEQSRYLQTNSRQLATTAGAGTLWEFVSDAGFVRIKNQDGTALDSFQGGDFVHSADWLNKGDINDQRWSFEGNRIKNLGDGGYLTYDYSEGDLEIHQWEESNTQKWYFDFVAEKAAVGNARTEQHSRQAEYDKIKSDLDALQSHGSLDRKQLKARVAQIDQTLDALKVELSNKNDEALKQRVKNLDPELAFLCEDSRKLQTYGALLTFVRPASRLSVSESCEGNVQLSYFDQESKIQLCNYDATADSTNRTYEQWITPNPSSCLEFRRSAKLVRAINAGGEKVGMFDADTGFTGGKAGKNLSNVSGTGDISDEVYRTFREGEYSYKFSGLTPNANYLVTLYFAEHYRGYRKFQVDVNGKRELDKYEIFTKAAGKNRAVQESLHIMADNSGVIVLTFVQHSYFDSPLVNAIAIFEEKTDASSEVLKFDGSIQLNTKGATVETWFHYPLSTDVHHGRLNSNILISGDLHVEARTRIDEMGHTRQELHVNTDPLSVRHDGGLIPYCSLDSLKPGWHHLAVVKKSGERVVYLNGDQIDQPLFPYSVDVQCVNEAIKGLGRFASRLIKYGALTDQFGRKEMSVHLPLTSEKDGNLRIKLSDIEHAKPGSIDERMFDSPDDGYTWETEITVPLHRRYKFRGEQILQAIPKSLRNSKPKEAERTFLLPRNWEDAAGQRLKVRVEDLFQLTGTDYLANNKAKEVDIWLPLEKTHPAELFSISKVGNGSLGLSPFGKIAELRFWNVALSDEEIEINSKVKLTGNEPGLIAYFPMDEGKGTVVHNRQGNAMLNGTITERDWSFSCPTIGKLTDPAGETEAVPPNSLIAGEYSTFGLDAKTGKRTSMMRRFLAWPESDGVSILTEKRIEDLELAWVGNAQFEPTLLGYIEGAPPVPSENLTLEDDYNGATSIELSQAEDVEFSWTRAQDAGLGATVDIFAGVETEADAGMVISSKIAATKAGFKGNLDFSYQFQNESSIASSSSTTMADRLELHGTVEDEAKFPNLGKRFIPKNVGYALVVSSLADVFISRLSRTKRMVGYQVLPVKDIPPDVNTITFLINPAYTMNGSLDGQTGTGAASDRFYPHVPESRAQYGSLYPASYYRLKEAYALKKQIQEEDKRRQSYFEQFNALLVDETSLSREVGKGPEAKPIEVGDGAKDGKKLSKKEQEARDKAEKERIEKEGKARQKEQQKAVDAKKAQIESRISNLEKKAHATQCFANWQKKLEDLQLRAGKRNIVNTYVWDGDGGLRSEAQSFANSASHTIGGSFNLNAGLGAEGDFTVAGASVALTAQATVNMTQTMSKSETRSKSLELAVDLSGVECRGITDYNDHPILPGEKVDRYRFMTFYLEGSVNHFHDFFNQVVDPEWLASNDEEARALRQARDGKPNKAWRVMHRVTYVERPALMGFGRDLRQVAEVDSDQPAISALHEKISSLESMIESQAQQLRRLDEFIEKLDTITSVVQRIDEEVKKPKVDEWGNPDDSEWGSPGDSGTDPPASNDTGGSDEFPDL